MKPSLITIVLAAGLASASAGDSLFSANSLGKEVLQSNERLARNWFFEVTGGPAFGVNGDVTQATDAYCNARLDPKSFDDAFGTAWLYGARFGKHVDLHDVYLRLVYTQAGGGTTGVGTSADGDVLGTFSDYSDFGILAGVRREFMQPSRIHPYAGVEAGVRFIDGISVNVNSPEMGSTGNLPFYDETAVFTAEITVGVAFEVTDAFRIGIETGLRYQGPMDESDHGLVSNGLENFNNSDSMLFVPLLLTGTVSF